MSPPPGDPLFDDVLGPHEQSPGAPATSPNSAIISSFFDDVFKDHEGPQRVPVPTPRPAQVPYGAVERFVDSLNAGFGPGIGELAWRMRGAPREAAAAHGEEIRQARDQYARENPGASLAYDLLGGVAPAIAALETGGAGLARFAPQVGKGLEALKSLGWGGRRAAEAITGAGAGAALGALPSGEHDAPLGERMGSGALTGGVFTPMAGGAIEPLLSRIPALAAQSAEALRNLGVKLPAGALPGVSPVLKGMNKVYGDAGAVNREELTRAALATVGAEGKPFHSATARGVYERLGDQFAHFANMAEGAELNDPHLRRGIYEVLQEAAAPGSGVSEQGYKSLLEQAKTILGSEGANPISGKTFLQLTRNGGPLARLSKDGEVGDYASQMWDHLNDSLERQVSSGFGRWVPQGTGSGVPQGASGVAEGLYGGLAGPAARRALPEAFPEPPTFKWTQNRDEGGRFASGKSPWASGFTHKSGDLVPGRQEPNFTLGGQPLEGTLENGTPHPEVPGLEWQYNPGAEGLLSLLRDTRAQWRNMKVLEPLVDDTTGVLNDPRKLAARVGKAFGKSPKSKLQQSSRDLLSLGEADNFIPPSKGTPQAPTIWDKLGGKIPLTGAFGAGILGAESLPLMHELATDWKPILLGGLAAGAAGLAGKGANKVAQGSWNTQRLINNALLNHDAGVLPLAELLSGPAIALTRPADSNEKERSK